MSKLSTLIKSNTNLKTKISTSLKQGGGITVKDKYLITPSSQIKINSETLTTPIQSEKQQKVSLVDDSIIKGGYHVVGTIEQRDDILCCYRKQGMKVVVVGADFSFKEYVLKTSNCDENIWEEVIVNVDIDESEVSLVEDYSELGTDIESQMQLNIVLKNLLLQIQDSIDNIEVPTKTSELQNTGQDGVNPFITTQDIPAIPQQVNSDWNAVSGPARILNKPTIPPAQVNSNWNSNFGPSHILNKPRIPTNTSDLINDGDNGENPFITALDVPAQTPQVNSDWNSTTGVSEILNKPTTLSSFENDLPPIDISTKAEKDASNITDIITWRTALDVYNKSEINSKFINSTSESLTSIQQPTLVGNILTIKYIGENGIIQSQNVDLSNLITSDVTIVDANYDASTNIITLLDSNGDDYKVDLSEFSILTTTDVNGVTNLNQEGVTKLTVSRVGQTGDYNHLLNRPNTTESVNFEIVDGELIVQDVVGVSVILVDNELIIN